MKYFISCLLVAVIVTGCNRAQINREAVKAEINRVLNDWHKAAAEGDFKRYFNHFAGNSAIFMGTDADEYWTVPEFKDYAREAFKSGSAWQFTPLERHVYISKWGQVAWFDETLASPAFGLVRGSGVLVRVDTTWKIAHYNLSIPIPNSIVYEVVEKIKETRKKQSVTNK